MDTLSGISSQIPLSSGNLLTMKTNVVITHLVFSRNQIYISEEGGDTCSMLQSYCTDGEKSFCKVYKPDKNGMIKEEI